MTTPGTPPAPELSVLLTSWNTREETRRCLTSLHAAAASLSYEVIAVDNASTDGSAQMLAADHRVTLISNIRNVGFAAAVNQARQRASGKFILLLNSDVQFHAGALDTMVQFLRDRPDAAGVSPLYLNPDGTFQQHYVQLPSFAACLALFTVLRKVPGFREALHRFEMRGEDFSQPRELSSGSCLLLRSTVVGSEQIFDESFPIYWNDAILARQLEAAGHRTWMIPDAVVTHTRGASCRLLGPAMRFRHLLGSMVHYLEMTEPRHRVRIFRLVLIADHLLKNVCGRTTMLGWTDLRAALRADVGPLPDGDARDWAIIVGDQPIGLDVGTADLDDEIRCLLVESARDRRHPEFLVQQDGSSLWRATLPTTLPLGAKVPAVTWVNDRIAAARLRRWLDHHAGARTLQVDDRHRYLEHRLGHDIAVTTRPAGTRSTGGAA